ncbi:MAG: DUF4274 domain-containing protein [Treponema sp.]|jgi:hypothetical protein|nr:DUF4274 domain-containing protein [Treponema sp.]
MDTDFLDECFSETRNPDINIFNALTTSEELHYVAKSHNWDCGVKVLEWIVKSPLCSEATALMLFWLAQPYYLQKYELDAKKVESAYDRQIIRLIRTIMENFQNGFYQKTHINYDPQSELREFVTIADIPELLCEGSKGKEPDIDPHRSVGTNVLSASGSKLEELIMNCKDRMDLYRIVYHNRNLLDCYKQILESTYCDKGIAPLMYWRIRTRYSNSRLDAMKDMEEKVVGKMNDKQCEEVIRYEPKSDWENASILQAKWDIPEMMKKPIGPPEIPTETSFNRLR